MQIYVCYFQLLTGHKMSKLYRQVNITRHSLDDVTYPVATLPQNLVEDRLASSYSGAGKRRRRMDGFDSCLLPKIVLRKGNGNGERVPPSTLFVVNILVGRPFERFPPQPTIAFSGRFAERKTSELSQT